MITRIPSEDHVPQWQRNLARAITDPSELLEALELDPEEMPLCTAAMRQFPLRVTRSYVDRMNKGDPNDPLLLQVLPTIVESIGVPGYSLDPLQESDAMAAPGVIQKYKGRLLLTVTGACGIHCRYCFRRHFPYSDANPASGNWRYAIEYISGDSSIREIILSGGDPLVMSDTRLTDLCSRLAELSHVSRLRIHTRLPVVLPERVDDSLVNWLANTRLQCVVVLHVNHPNEIDDTVIKACDKLRSAGVTLLNQSVLLKNINDKVTTLAQLSEKLFAAGVLPYYLHQLDRVRGAAHFEVTEADAQSIMDGLHGLLPGYLLPRFVREVPGAAGKLGAWHPGRAPCNWGLPVTRDVTTEDSYLIL